MVRKLIFILVFASLTAGCGQSRPVEQRASSSRGTAIAVLGTHAAINGHDFSRFVRNSRDSNGQGGQLSAPR